MASWVTGTYSHVDRLWSITPAAYACAYAYLSDFDLRCTLMALLTVAWGARLTWNFARKGGYSAGEQDYRWPVLRAHPLLRHPIAWQLFNVGFIASYQHLLLLLIASPSSAAYRARGAPLNPLDVVAAAAVCFFIALETVADQQQWNFQQSKRNVAGFPRQRVGRDDYSRGFLTRGLFRFSRHPNFFAEQCVWISYYVFSVAAESGGVAPADWRGWCNRTGVGAVLLVMLFQGSTAFTESITAKKYPEYAKYQITTSRLIPMPPFAKLPPPKKHM